VVPNSGSKNIIQDQGLVDGGTTGTTKSKSTLALPIGLPAEWLEGLSQLQTVSPHPAYGWDHWHQLTRDAERFLLDRGERAAELGWTTLDLFGVHPAAPTARYDAMGLLPLIIGKSVVSLTERSATIRGPSGNCLSYVRGARAGGVPIWTIGTNPE
jgi:hypothetical protein